MTVSKALPDEIEVEHVFRTDGRIAEMAWFPPNCQAPNDQQVAELYDYVPTIDAPIETNHHGTRYQRVGRYVLKAVK